MEFLNIGSLELILILVIGFVVLGPNRITKLGRDLGTTVRRLSKNEAFRDVIHTTDEIRQYPRKIVQDAMLDQPIAMDPDRLKTETKHPDEQDQQ